MRELRQSHISTVAMISIAILTPMVSFIIAMTLFNNGVMADDSVAVQASIVVPIACTMRGTGTESHTATLAPNTYSGASDSEYENGIGKTTLTAICNDDNGFSIYAIGYTGNSYDLENHTKLVGTNTGGVIATKAYASGDTTSNWSMKLTKVTDTTESYNPQNLTIQSDTEGTFSNWHSIPSTYTKVAQYHANTGSSTTDTTLGVKLETTYAAYISSSQPADTYIGQVKYTMVHPYTEEPLQPQSSASGKICYYANASSAEGTMGCQNVASSVTLLASNFSRTGYGFAGWSDKFDYATNSEAKFYGPQETMTIPDTSIYNGEGKGLSLYAVWVKSQGNLQDSTKVSEVCNRLDTAPTDGTASLSSVSALTDSRDNNTYAIAKLADGKCWMIENLRLDNAAELTTLNTNNPLNDGTDVTLKHNYNDTQTYNTLSATSSVAYNETYAPDGWCVTQTYACIFQSRLRTDNTVSRASNISSNSNVNIFSYGNYYNWYSATAGQDVINNDAAGNLCPYNWKLPSDSVNVVGRFRDLDIALGGLGSGTNANSTNWRRFPNNYIYSGSVSAGSIMSRGSSGSYWTGTQNSYKLAQSLFINSTNVRPGLYDSDSYKFYGMVIRCVAGV